MKPLIDQRPFVKTAIPTSMNDYVTILRMNQTTQKVYSVVIKYDVWVAFRKNRDVKVLSDAKLTEEVIDFITNNIIRGEKR